MTMFISSDYTGLNK